MENKDTDVVYKMDINQRLEHLIAGYFGKTYSQYKKYISTDIIAICIDYTGISYYSSYNLIQSNTEIKLELQAKKSRADYVAALKSKNKPILCDMKVILCGSKGVGKSALYNRFESGIFLDEYDTTVESGYIKQTMVEDIVFFWYIMDPYKNESMTDECITEAKYFIFVYDITNTDSIKRILSLIDQVQTCKNTQDGSNWYGSYLC